MGSTVVDGIAQYLAARTLVDETPAAFGNQGHLRAWLHTKGGAKILNAGTAWFKVAAPRGFAVLNTVGRRTGLRRQSNVRLLLKGRKGFLVSIAGSGNNWRWNLRADPQVTLRIGRETYAGVVRPIADEKERLEARTAYSQVLHWFDFVSSVVNQRGVPSPSRLREMHARWFDLGEPLVVELAEAP